GDWSSDVCSSDLTAFNLTRIVTRLVQWSRHCVHCGIDDKGCVAILPDGRIITRQHNNDNNLTVRDLFDTYHLQSDQTLVLGLDNGEKINGLVYMPGNLCVGYSTHDAVIMYDLLTGKEEASWNYK